MRERVMLPLIISLKAMRVQGEAKGHAAFHHHHGQGQEGAG